MAGMKTIGVILNDGSRQGFNHAFFSEILEGFKLFAEEKEYRLLFLNNKYVHKDSKTYVNQLTEAGCEGCLLLCREGSEEIDEVRSSGIPMVAIDEEYDDVICVSSDNSKGMEALTEYLIEMGHREIAIILGDDNWVTNCRFNAFLRICEKNKVKIPEEYICRGKYRDMDLAYYHTENLVKLKNPPSAIMYPDDYAAIGGINVLNARAQVISRDISITGYDCNNILNNLHPKLTTIKQNGAEMGRLAAEKLIAEIENPSVKQTGRYIVDVALEKGETVGKKYI